jgi:hypothetical protein
LLLSAGPAAIERAAVTHEAAPNLLPPLPTPKDNVAMEGELSPARPKGKRRWYQFSLRTLLTAVTLLSVFCAYLGWQARIVNERNALRDRIEKMGAEFTYTSGPTFSILYLERNPMPWPRNWLGDKRAGGIDIPAAFSKDEIEHVRRVFPEAYLYRAGNAGESL